MPPLRRFFSFFQIGNGWSFIISSTFLQLQSGTLLQLPTRAICWHFSALKTHTHSHTLTQTLTQRLHCFCTLLHCVPCFLSAPVWLPVPVQVLFVLCNYLHNTFCQVLFTTEHHRDIINGWPAVRCSAVLSACLFTIVRL